jgi:hypothetical protein
MRGVAALEVDWASEENPGLAAGQVCLTRSVSLGKQGWDGGDMS